MRELLEFWLFIAFIGMLLLLRFDAFRFGVAEYDDEDRHGGWRGWLRRLSFYALGIAKKANATEPYGDAPLSAKIVAVVSLLLWFGVIYFGRFIMYNDTLLYAWGL